MFSIHNSFLLVYSKNILLFSVCKYSNFFFNLNFLNLGILGNRGQGNICNGKTQDVSHIAFGSKILGPPPSLNRRTKAKVPGKVRAKFQQHHRHFCKERY